MTDNFAQATTEPRITDAEFREILAAGFDRPASWPKAVCRNIGCGVIVGCFRPDCPAQKEIADDAR